MSGRLCWRRWTAYPRWRRGAYDRGRDLYMLDAGANVRFSHENRDIVRIYDEYLEKPNSHKAHMLLHTEHIKE
ncbi:MAG: iron hydrogenase small subunit [[Clostridium] scindens]